MSSNLPILLDVSLTGGRGPAKKAYELITDLRDKDIPYKVITDRLFRQKLVDMGISPDFVVNTDLTDDPVLIIKKFDNVIQPIEFSLMVKMGARVAGPIAGRKLGKPYLLVDGGLPDYLTEEEGLYERRTFEEASQVVITSQFPWQPPSRIGLKNIEVCGFPLSEKTWSFLQTLKNKSKAEILSSISNKVDGTFSSPDQLLINLVMTGDYFNMRNRVTFGGWLTTQQYDQCVGFVRRLVNDLGETFTKQNITIFMDREVAAVASDLFVPYPRLNLVTFLPKWDYNVELSIQAAADLTISRATNYQPYIAALTKGGSITTPVPADGYMDEDTAALQYENKELTKRIAYDEENYVAKVIQFLDDKNAQQKIAGNLKDNVKFLKERNLNKLIIELWKSV